MTLALEDLPNDVAALKALILAAHAQTITATAAVEAAQAERDAALSAAEAAKALTLATRAEADRIKAQCDRLEHVIAVLRRAHFGQKSEKITTEQMELALDDMLTAMGAEDAGAEAASIVAKQRGIEKRKANRGHLPAHLPREEIVIEPDTTACPCCGGALHRIGEDRSERLDKVPAKLRVLVTRRPKYACRSCEKTGADDIAGIIQAPAPVRLIEGGIPTEALVADVLVSKYADHLPLYRQAQIFARDGLVIDRSTLCHTGPRFI